MRDFDQMQQKVSGDRARLAQSLDTLRSAVDPHRVSQQVSDVVRASGGEIGAQAWTAAQKNPAAFALVGAGIALLLTGTGARASGAFSDDMPHDRTHANSPADAMVGFDDRVAAAEDQMNKEMTGMIDEPSPRADRLRAALEHGLDKLPPAARTRVIKARRAALSAQERVEREAHRAAKKARGFHNEQPLAAGALALSFGALLGAFLPSTRREDALLGRERDALMRKAQDALQAELDKVADIAKDKLDHAAGTMKSSAPSEMATIPPGAV